MSLHNKTLLHEGDTTNIFQGSNNDVVHLHFKDSSTVISQSGILHNMLSEKFFSCLNTYHVPTHFIKSINLREQEVFNTKVLPITVRLTNIVHHDFHQRLGMSAGQSLQEPLMDFISDYTGTIIDSAYLPLLNICTPEQMLQIKQIAYRVNDILRAMSHTSVLTPASLDLRFGFFDPVYSVERSKGLLLIDELTPNTMQFWNKQQQCLMQHDLDLIKILTQITGMDTTRWNEELYGVTEKEVRQKRSLKQNANIANDHMSNALMHNNYSTEQHIFG